MPPVDIPNRKPSDAMLRQMLAEHADQYDWNSPQGRNLIATVAHELLQLRQMRELVLSDSPDHLAMGAMAAELVSARNTIIQQNAVVRRLTDSTVEMASRIEIILNANQKAMEIRRG